MESVAIDLERNLTSFSVQPLPIRREMITVILFFVLPTPFSNTIFNGVMGASCLSVVGSSRYHLHEFFWPNLSTTARAGPPRSTACTQCMYCHRL